MRYVIYTTTPITLIQSDGTPVEYPANTIVNAIEWDGISDYDPGANFVLAQSDTLEVLDLYVPAG